jgi:RNA polymerase sigma factor (sigma-70 family)
MEAFDSLVVLAQASDVSLDRRRDAFGKLVVRFQDMAYGYAYAILGNTYLAQEAAQEAFISAYETLGQLREPKAFPGWLRRIVLTQCSRLTRGKRAMTLSLDTVPHLSADQSAPAAMAENQELREHLSAAVNALPEGQRLATVLYYIDGYSQSEIAEFLEVSVDAVKKRLQRARERLQERMVEMVQDNLQEQRPSKDDEFVRTVRLFTALDVVAQQSQLETLELMLVDGMSVDAQNKDGQTLLHWAAQRGYWDMVELLIKNKAVLNIRDRFGRTPLQEAVEGGHTKVADLIRQYGGKE